MRFRKMLVPTEERATLLGSVAEAMIRKSPCPVLVVRPDHEIESPAL